MSMYGARDPMKPRELKGHDQKEEEPDPTRQEKPSLRIFLARRIADQVTESLE